MKPRILISTSSNPRTVGLTRVDSIGGFNYAKGVAESGGLPFFAPNLSPDLAAKFVTQSDGLLLSGGADFDPSLYGQAPHPDLGMVEESRDVFELALYKAAKAKGVPILGICRGVQAINIAEGGSLYQHLPAAGERIQHQQRNIDGTLFHSISLDDASALKDAFASNTVRTNSYHHQAIDQLGENLKAIAWAEDGTIEAVEGTGDSFVLGVQWHPEMSFERYPEQIAPFKVFMQAINKIQKKKEPEYVLA